MKPGHFLVILTGIALTVVLFLLRSEPKSQNALSALIENSKNELETSIQSRINGFEKNWLKEQDLNALDSLINIWSVTGNEAVTAVYTYQKAIQSSSVHFLKEAGLILQRAANYGQVQGYDQTLLFFFVTASEECFNMVLEQKPDDLDAKIGLANSFIDGKGDIMSGVRLLLDVVKEDSLNIKANRKLGRLSMINGEYEKVIMRMNKVLATDSLDFEAHVLIANSYGALNNNKSARDYFNKALELTDNEDLINEIINRLEDLKD